MLEDGAFLTEVALDDPEGLETVDGMDNVRKLNRQLNGFVDNLNEKIRKLLEEQESDFLSAYRHHIYHVQKELQSWKDKVKEEEMGIKKDSQIRQFKNERDWFKDEALRLGNFTDRMKSDMEALKTKMQEVVEDRAWLRKQLKLAKKQSKFLTVELEQARRGGGGGGGLGLGLGGGADTAYPLGFALADSDNDNEGDNEPLVASPSAIRTVPPTTTSFSDNAASAWGARPASSQSGRPTSSRSAAAAFGDDAAAMSSTDSSMGSSTLLPPVAAAASASAPPASADAAEAAVLLARYRRIVDQLRRKLEGERKASQALRLQNANRSMQQQALEELFVKCIDDARRGAARRKGGKGAMLPSVAPGRGGGGSPLISKEDLTSKDRKGVVQRLLADDQILLFLYRSMFSDVSGDQR